MVWLIILGFFVLALIVVAIAFAVDRRYGTRWPNFSTFAQGLAAIATVVALFIAAGIYFLERRDKPRVEFDMTATRALIPPRDRQGAQVLLGIRVLVRNSGSQQMIMNCMALDIAVPFPRGRLVRSEGSPEEMNLRQLHEPIPFPRRLIPACLRREERRDQAGNVVRPLYMWAPLTLEAGETDDGYFEMLIPCDYPFVRVIAKMRIRPDDELAYETKAVIPLREICQGAGNGMAASVVAESRSTATVPIAPAPAQD